MLDYNKLPLVSYIIILTRQNDKPEWVNKCIQSIKLQYYPHKEIVTIDNEDKDKSIGKCWNMGIKKANGLYCMFVGDDDKLSPDYTMSLIITILNMKSKYNNKFGVTSYLTIFDNDMKVSGTGDKFPTGMWQKDYLLENPFNENLKKRVDTNYYEHNSEQAVICNWQYGYFYRQHNNMVSGRNISEKKMKEITNKRKKQNRKNEEHFKKTKEKRLREDSIK